MYFAHYTFKTMLNISYKSSSVSGVGEVVMMHQLFVVVWGCRGWWIMLGETLILLHL